jgi:hypothetical protein
MEERTSGGMNERMSFVYVMVNWDVPSITLNAWPANYLLTIKN